MTISRKHFIRGSYEYLKLGTRTSQAKLKKLYSSRKGKAMKAWRSLTNGSLNFALIGPIARNSSCEPRFSSKPV
jgi:hypothetical protein